MIPCACPASPACDCHRSDPAPPCGAPAVEVVALDAGRVLIARCERHAQELLDQLAARAAEIAGGIEGVRRVEILTAGTARYEAVSLDQRKSPRVEAVRAMRALREALSVSGLGAPAVVEVDSEGVWRVTETDEETGEKRGSTALVVSLTSAVTRERLVVASLE